jgi:hypothetical protein
MPRRGKARHQDEPILWHISIPRSVVEEVEEALRDPLTQKTAFGARAKLVTRLLRQWLADRKEVRKELGELSLDDLNEPA